MQISLSFVPKDPIDNEWSLVQVIARYRNQNFSEQFSKKNLFAFSVTFHMSSLTIEIILWALVVIEMCMEYH